MHSEICCGLYRGKVYLKDLSSPTNPLLPVGNAEFTLNQTLTEITQPNYQSLGGNNCKVAYPEEISLDMTLHCISPENLALAFMGQDSVLTGDEVEDEEHSVNGIHELIPFNFVPDKSQPIVVTNEAGSTTYVAGEDYVVTNVGIEIIEGSTIPVDGSIIKISYAYGNNYKVDAQTVGQKEYLFVFDGANYGEGGQRQVKLVAHKVKFDPTDSFAMLSGQEFASLAVSGEILRDESQATGSKFFSVEWGAEAQGVY